jgi:hypothetical protein
VSSAQAIRLIGPAPGQIEPAVDEGMSSVSDVGGEHADLAVGDLARRAGVLSLHPAGGGALLEKAGFIQHQDSIRCCQGLEGIVAHQVA